MKFNQDLADHVISIIQKNLPVEDLEEGGALTGAAVLGVFAHTKEVAHRLVDFVFAAADAVSSEDVDKETTWH